MKYPLALAVLLTACSDQGLTFKREDPVVIEPGGIKGRVCDPSGRTWLPDAFVYVNLVDEDGVIYDTVEAYSDIDGRWTLDDLPGDRTYTVYVTYGAETLMAEEVYIGSGEWYEFDEPDCFDPVSIDIAIVTGDYDNFDLVLNQLGFVNYELVDGLDGEVLNAFLGDPESLARFDIIFFNGGFNEDHVIYDIADPTNPVPERNLQNLRDYVFAGGNIYASDWAYDLVERAWPSQVDFVGADEVPDDAQKGDFELVNAVVSDAAMAEYLGGEYVEIQYDLPVWPPIESVADSTSTHLSGTVPYSDGMSEYTLTAVPLLVSFNGGQGKVVFSTFRVVPNTSDDMLAILQYMMYRL